jgi:uncharacterized membrane protein HdeD (DUF308 family)
LAGGFEIAYAIHTRGHAGLRWKLASGILTLLLGIAILLVPLTGFSLIATSIWRVLLAGQHLPGA